jgi:hypothetical protein
MKADPATIAQQGLESLALIIAERDSLRASTDQWEAAYTKAQAENELLRAELEHAKHERSFYQRWAVELSTQLSTVGDIVAKATQAAKDNAYRPNGGAPKVPKVAMPESGETNPEDLKFLKGLEKEIRANG